MRGTKALSALAIALAAIVAAGWWWLERARPASPSSVSAHEPPPSPRDASSGSEPSTELSAPDAERGSAAKAAPAPARSAGAAPTAKELARVAATFRTEQPDIDALRALAARFATEAAIDEASLRTDDAGVRHGAFTIPGTSLRGTFAIEGDGYDVTLPVDALAGATGGFTRTELSIRARDDRGVAANPQIALRFHPDMHAKAGGGFDAERIVGWTAYATRDGTVAEATSARRLEDGAWRIGKAEHVAALDRPGDRDARANEAWLARLRPYARAK